MLEVHEVSAVVDHAELLGASSVNFLKGANQESEWDQFYNEENTAFNGLDNEQNGVSIAIDE